MGWLQRVRSWLSSGATPTGATTAGRGLRVSGEPPSGNGASSFHLTWELPGELVAVAVTLEVAEPPSVDRLYFWALQVDFTNGGRAAGGGHLGFQHHPQYPGRTAVNWGGYDAGGAILPGTASRLPGALDNPHTRNLAWQPGRPYRLAVGLAPPDEQPAGGATAWRGTVTDLVDATTVVVLDLLPQGSRLVRPMVWSEVFARCEQPAVEVRWSDPWALTDAGQTLRPGAVVTNYQRREEGGCDNTCSWTDGDQLVQRTCTERRIPQGTRLPLAGTAGSTGDVEPRL